MKTVLITNSASGIGHGIAHGFAKLNYRIIVNKFISDTADAMPIDH